MLTIIFDADFLSSFLKIGRCDLVREFYRIERAWVPAAVYRELAQTDLLPALLAVPWVHVPSAEPLPDEVLVQNNIFQMLGAGERACITLAYTQTDVAVLMSDNQARRLAQSLGINVVNIPAFLLACKIAGILDSRAIAQIVQDLKDKDFYEFRKDIRNELLK